MSSTRSLAIDLDKTLLNEFRCCPLPFPRLILKAADAGAFNPVMDTTAGVRELIKDTNAVIGTGDASKNSPGLEVI